jgi:CRP-like cAMP-binding protein
VGDHVTFAGVVLSGVLREVFIDADGEERTRTFSFEGDLVSSWSDVLAQRPSRTRIEALSDAEVQLYDVASIRALEPAAPDLRHVLRLIAESLYLRKADREFELLTLSASQRYDALLARLPLIEERVQLQHIASYLGITPVYLSRLRRRRRALRTPSPRAR